MSRCSSTMLMIMCKTLMLLTCSGKDLIYDAKTGNAAKEETTCQEVYEGCQQINSPTKKYGGGGEQQNDRHGNITGRGQQT